MSSLYHSVSRQPFARHIAEMLCRPIAKTDITIDAAKGWLYLKPSAYKGLLNDAFGETGWRIVPVGPARQTPTGKVVYRPFALLVNDHFVSEAIGEASVADFVDKPSHLLAWCQYIALVRTCKDLGVASELWDPAVVNKMRSELFEAIWLKDAKTGLKKRSWRRKPEK
eukprot:jgi/Hompol1/5505/HPOL_001950-RA